MVGRPWLTAILSAVAAALMIGVAPAHAAQKSYYEILEVPKDADAKAIKSAYRKMALKWHPDKHTSDKEEAEQRFREVAEAYEVLSDPERRRQYDHGGDVHQQGPASGAGFEGVFGDAFRGFRDPKDLFKDMFGDSDPFADFSKFFDDVHIHEEPVGGGNSEDLAKAQEDLAKSLATFYGAVGKSDRATPKAALELLKMPKWVGKEQKMLRSLKAKYPEPQYRDALGRLSRAFDAFEQATNRGGGRGASGGFGDFGGGMPGMDFGGFGDLGKMFGGAFGGGGGFGGGASMSFSSFSSSSTGGKTVRQETKVVNGKRVTKTIESDASGTRATLEEEAGGRVRRQTGTKKSPREELGHSSFGEEM